MEGMRRRMAHPRRELAAVAPILQCLRRRISVRVPTEQLVPNVGGVVPSVTCDRVLDNLGHLLDDAVLRPKADSKKMLPSGWSLLAWTA
jgi:hypothetical protein